MFEPSFFMYFIARGGDKRGKKRKTLFSHCTLSLVVVALEEARSERHFVLRPFGRRFSRSGKTRSDQKKRRKGMYIFVVVFCMVQSVHNVSILRRMKDKLLRIVS